MHERELRAFVVIADIGHMDRAASMLGYSQPAVSYQIKCLEQALGVRLFDRDWDRLRLTSEGRMILPSARAVLALIDGIKRLSPEPHRSPLVEEFEWAANHLRRQLKAQGADPSGDPPRP